MDGNHIFFEAIVRQRCVRATYNRGDVLLAPHILYLRNGDLFVDAVTLSRDGRRPREAKLGAFKIAGLGGPRVTDATFVPDPMFDRSAERYRDAALFMVEPQPSPAVAASG